MLTEIIYFIINSWLKGLSELAKLQYQDNHECLSMDVVSNNLNFSWQEAIERLGGAHHHNHELQIQSASQITFFKN